MNCNNCGKKGHMYKDCKLPVTSCGHIIFRDDGVEPKVLMIQRKDSLCYIDFLRGKYDMRDLKYIQVLIDKCSKTNKNIQSSFDCASKVFNKKYPRKKRSKKKNPKNTKKLHKTKTRKSKTRKTKRRM